MNTWLRYFTFWRRDPRADAREEIRFHLDMRVRDLVTRGMTEDEARATAQREFGDATAVEQQVERIDRRMIAREERTEWWTDLGRDIRVSLRSLRSSPAFTVTAVACAALGIGATAAVLSAAYAILVRPLPYADADRLVAIYGENTDRGYTRTNISGLDYFSWRDENRGFDAIGLWNFSSHTLADDGSDAERVQGATITAELFPLLRVRPALGRLFLPEEDRPGGEQVVLLSDMLWRRRYGGDSAIVGHTILVDGNKATVVGVMPPGFNFPDRGEIWRPFRLNRATESHGDRFYTGAIGRLKAGVSFEQGVADLHRIDAELQRQLPNENAGWRAQLVTLRDDLVGDLRQPLKVFLWAVALVLLMVCANVANLMLARGATRTRELALRTALGASRRRLVRQLLTESVLVAAIGGAIGVWIAWGGVRLLRFGFPDQAPPFFIRLELNGWTLLFVLAATVVTGVLCGTWPSVTSTRVNLNNALREGSAGAGHSAQRARGRGFLVASEVALSVVLMIGALLLVRSYHNLASTNLGFDEQGILSARISLPNTDYPSRAHNLAFYDRLLERLRQLPGVERVASAQGIPFSGWDVQSAIKVEGAPTPPGGDIVAHFQVVTPEYFQAIGVPLLRGRWLTAADRDSMAPVILVNEQMVAKAFDGRDPIGRRVRVFGTPGDSIATVVGVVRDFRHYRLPQPMGPAAYFTYATWPARTQTVVLRTRSRDPSALVPAVRAAVREIDPKVALYQVQTFEETVSRSLWRQRLQGNVLTVFAAMSLVLACIGLYGVISYAVARRTRELGVRIALGATSGSVVWLVLRDSGRLVLAGIAVGLLTALFGVRILSTLLYGVQPTDVVTFATVPALLAIVALLASAIPARRATRVNPIIAMRAE